MGGKNHSMIRFSLDLDPSVYQTFDLPTRSFPETFYVLRDIPYIIHAHYITSLAICVNVYQFTALPSELTPQILRDLVRNLNQGNMTHIRKKMVAAQSTTQVISFKPFTYNNVTFNFTITKHIEDAPGI